jgi:hypothetical protein
MVLSTACPACDASADFYQAVAKEAASREDVDLYVLSLQPVDEMRAWLTAHGISAANVVMVDDPIAVGIAETPMVVLLNVDGRIAHIAESALSISDQARVIEALEHWDVAPVSLTFFCAGDPERQAAKSDVGWG